jgi:hypothetical protein
LYAGVLGQLLENNVIDEFSQRICLLSGDYGHEADVSGVISVKSKINSDFPRIIGVASNCQCFRHCRHRPL